MTATIGTIKGPVISGTNKITYSSDVTQNRRSGTDGTNYKANSAIVAGSQFRLLSNDDTFLTGDDREQWPISQLQPFLERYNHI